MSICDTHPRLLLPRVHFPILGRIMWTVPLLMFLPFSMFEQMPPPVSVDCPCGGLYCRFCPWLTPSPARSTGSTYSTTVTRPPTATSPRIQVFRPLPLPLSPFSSALRCYIVNDKLHFFKVEVLSKKPIVLRYHQLIHRRLCKRVLGEVKHFNLQRAVRERRLFLGKGTVPGRGIDGSEQADAADEQQSGKQLVGAT